MDVERLSPVSRDLLKQALSGGQLVNELYRDGSRLERGFERERRCFALGERGWLSFLGWDGQPAEGSDCISRWALTDEAQSLLGKG
jgi:hypothetical protein